MIIFTDYFRIATENIQMLFLKKLLTSIIVKLSSDNIC